MFRRKCFYSISNLPWWNAQAARTQSVGTVRGCRSRRHPRGGATGAGRRNRRGAAQQARGGATGAGRRNRRGAAQQARGGATGAGRCNRQHAWAWEWQKEVGTRRRYWPYWVPHSVEIPCCFFRGPLRKREVAEKSEALAMTCGQLWHDSPSEQLEPAGGAAGEAEKPHRNCGTCLFSLAFLSVFSSFLKFRDFHFLCNFRWAAWRPLLGGPLGP